MASAAAARAEHYSITAEEMPPPRRRAANGYARFELLAGYAAASREEGG